jgi:hypothetical protein
MRSTLIILVISLFFTSCSKEKRYIRDINKSWKMQEYQVNGSNQTNEFKNVFSNYTLTFYDNKTFNENWVTIIPMSNSGNYDFIANATIIEMRDVNNTRRFKINTIEKNKLDAEYTETLSNGSTEVRRYILIPV